MTTAWNKLKAAAYWVYNWITVLTASLVGLPTLLLQFLNFVGAVDLSPIVGTEVALQIITGVAIAKAILAFLESRAKAHAEAKAKHEEAIAAAAAKAAMR